MLRFQLNSYIPFSKERDNFLIVTGKKKKKNVFCKQSQVALLFYFSWFQYFFFLIRNILQHNESIAQLKIKIRVAKN